MKKIMVTIPTYNERENIERLIKEIHCQRENIEIIVADDNSPDRTWTVVKKISEENPRVHLLHRKKNKGRGYAGIDAFKYALEKGADYIIEMDADFSHHPKFIPSFLEKIEEYDVVIGSRAVSGGMDAERPFLRRLISRMANLYIRAFLGVKVMDCTSGYRCFRREVLERVDLDSFFSTGPAIVQELLYKAYLQGFSFVEIPIVFTNRHSGESKLDIKKLIKGLLMVLKLKFSVTTQPQRHKDTKIAK